MDNIVAFFVVLMVVSALMVLAALWFYVLIALYVVYWLMRLSAWLYDKRKAEHSKPTP